MTSPAASNSDARSTPTEHLRRQCPTLAGDSLSLITHRIEVGNCLRRQREFYHKCHRCLYRGQAANYVIDHDIRLTAVGEGGLPRDTLELPRGARVED